MSSRSRLVLLTGLVALGAAVYAVVALVREDVPAAEAAAAAYLADWSAGDFTALEDRVVDPPRTFVTDHRAVVDDLGVTEATYDLTSVDVDGDVGVARYTARLRLDGIGTWRWDGALRLSRQRGTWRTSWSPSTIHPALGQGQHLAVSRDAPERAPILDRAGEPLSTSRPARLIGLEPRAITDLDAVKAAFRDLLGVDPVRIDEALGAPGVEPDHFVPVTTVDRARYDRVAPVIHPLPGTRFRDVVTRGGPTPDFAAHVIGRYGEITAERLEELGSPYRTGDLVGLTGLEGRYEEQLAGTPSFVVQVVDDDGTPVRDLERFRGRAPRPLRTTLDARVQSAVDAALGTTARAMAVVVVDSRSNVRAVASRPLDQYDRALSGRYPPGSTFKIVTTAALLAHGVRPDTPVACPPTVDAGGRRFRNFERSSLGTVPFGRAFAESCNTAFITATAAVPGEQFVATAERFGFNARYTVGLDTAGASFPAPADATEQAAAAIGQGRVVASPLHMATVGGTVIDGTWDPPVLLPDTSPADVGTTALPARTAEAIRTLMRRVVTEGSGTRATVPGVDVAGKTGTAEYGSGDPPATHAWFVGLWGDLSVAVLVEDGTSGGEVAAPVAGRIISLLR
ncbi:MAG TPA: penicillin-binding transpeptidase domain-containing protein [Acidimicrobiales bacterium]|nr:penicillin-binding transpeptidase domain-containing protein [Acidimicrobiales bacterium]